jgi:hypothetical protein
MIDTRRSRKFAPMVIGAIIIIGAIMSDNHSSTTTATAPQPAAPTKPRLADTNTFSFILCEGDTCIRDWPQAEDLSFIECMTRKLAFIIAIEQRYGPVPRDEAIHRFRCVTNAVWHAAESELRAPVSEIDRLAPLD